MVVGRYCVYLHKTTEGVIFYVGHGTKRRPYARDKYTRGKKWINFVSQHPDFRIEIIWDDLTKDDAVELESLIISLVPSLINTHRSNSPSEYPSRDELLEYFTVYTKSPSGLYSVRSKKAVGTITNSNGKKYWSVKFKGRRLRAHRVICIISSIYIDKTLVVDHIDGNGLNNNLSNLRVCSQAENMSKVQTTGNPTLGFKFNKLTNCWVAYWQENSVQKTKSFSVRKYGEYAKELAKSYRRLKTELLP